MPTFDDEEPTSPEHGRAVRIAAERLLACPVQDLIVLARLREIARDSPEDLDRLMVSLPSYGFAGDCHAIAIESMGRGYAADHFIEPRSPVDFSSPAFLAR